MDEKIRGTLAGISASDDGTVATLAVIWSLKNKKSAIHVARLTIHEVDVRNRPDFSDKLVEDWRWQKR